MTEFGEDGRILFWRGNIVGGSKSERRYSYDSAGRIVSIEGSSGDDTDHFQYDQQGKKVRIRTVPPRPERRRVAISVNIIFETTMAGEVLTDGGTVTTAFDEWDEPAECEVRDSEGHLLSRITHQYDSKGKLIKEVLVRELCEFWLPKQFRDQIPPEQRESALEQIRARMGTLMANNAERSYVYNELGQMSERYLKIGDYVQSMTCKYNEKGDTSEMVLGINPGAQSGHSPEAHIEVEHLYKYDEHDNWIEQTSLSRVRAQEKVNTSCLRRQLSYF